MTAAKAEMIDASKSEGMLLAFDLAQHAVARFEKSKKDADKITLTDREVRAFVAEKLGVPETFEKLESLETIRTEMVRGGMKLVDEKFKSQGVRYRALVNHDIETDREWIARAAGMKMGKRRGTPATEKLPHGRYPDDVFEM
jgi:hypothetical protein